MQNKRIVTFGFFLTLVWMGMIGRIIYIQVFKHQYYANLSRKQSIRRNIIPPARGEVFDRNGKKLISNAKISRVFKEGRQDKHRKLKRVTPNGALAGQVLGNIGHDGYGQIGLEYSLDKTLRGVDGWRYVRYDVARRYHPNFKEEKKDPVNGADIHITIDLEIQKVTEQALERGVKRVGAKGGVAIVVCPATGDILSMANYPFYNPNRRTSQDIKSMRNNAISKVYEPGSTFKIITAAAAIQEAGLTPRTRFNAEDGVYKVKGAIVRDTKPKKYVSFKEAFAYSSNVVLVKSALKVKSRRFYQYIRSFGFGMKSGIELPAEESGLLNPVRKWNTRSQVTLAWGQEVNATPLQMTMACAAVANQGVLMKPRIILKKEDGLGKTENAYAPKEVRRVISEKTTEHLKTLMAAVVSFGTARKIDGALYSIGGKTGTAEKIDKTTGEYIKGSFHSSFVGMVPVEDPAYVCLVLIDEPQKDKYGGSCAAPVFREIMDRVLVVPGNALAVRVYNKKMPKASGRPEIAGISLPAPLKYPFKGVFRAGQKPKKNGALSAIRTLSTTDHSDSLEPPSSFVDWQMPDVKNLSLRDALIKLKPFPVDVAYKGVGKVVEQTPEAGKSLKNHKNCILRLAWMM